jgi:hypothetical protein
MRRTEENYSNVLKGIHRGVNKRPLLLEQQHQHRHQRQENRAVVDLERRIQHAMRVAQLSEDDLIRQKFNPANVTVRMRHRTDSA